MSHKGFIGFLLALFAASQIFKAYGNDSFGLSLVIGIVIFVFWMMIIPGKQRLSAKATPSEPKPPRDWKPLRSAVKFILLFLVSGTIVAIIAYNTIYTTSSPTTKPAWDIIQETTGIQQSKPRSPDKMEEYMRKSITKFFPFLSPKKADDYAKQLSQLALKSQTAQFQEEWTKMVNLESAVLIQSRKDAFTATNQPIQAILLIQVICALIMAVVSYTLWDQIKITPTIVIVLVIFAFYGFFLPHNTGTIASDLFIQGMSLALIDTIWGIGAALFSAFRILYKKPGGGLGVLITIGLTLGGVGFGFTYESYMQAQTLSNAVIQTNGLISIDQALFIFQLGKTAAIMGIVSMFSSLIAYTRATPALAQIQAEEEEAARARRQLNP